MSGNGQAPLRSSTLWHAKTRLGNVTVTNPVWKQWFWGATTTTSAGRRKVWNGTSWVVKPTKVWNGSAWVVKPTKFWNGTAWIS